MSSAQEAGVGVRLAGFGVALALAVGAGIGVGVLVGPIGSDPTPHVTPTGEMQPGH